MDLFNYKNGKLYCEDIAVEELASEFGTPLYIYSANTIKRHIDNFQQAFKDVPTTICYSVKVCSNINILKMVAAQGEAFDVVSGGELYRVLQAGGDPGRVVYAGVGKTDSEIRYAIEQKIGYFNIESEAELENIIKIAGEMGKVVNCALRVNPDVDPKTHTYTTTGKKESKFGVDIERAINVFETYGRNPNIRLCGIHLHIGSPVYTVEPYVEAITKTLAMIDELRTRGFVIDTLDIGGGYAADYTTGKAPSPADYARQIIPLVKDKGLKIILEPGRSIMGNAAIMVSRVNYTKTSGEKNFAIIDGAMNDLIRPMLYGAFHFIWPVNVSEKFAITDRQEVMDMPGLIKTDVVGPICESGDFLAQDRMLPPMKRGDLLAAYTAGAYGYAMASQYNSRPRAVEVLVDGSQAKIIRRRETWADLVAPELI
ncbi:MAG: diaminopimelate decarboxylase [Sedimentisphaerales bacterium]|nr:diaminopimelate decarboxylase [Sedimentisphaerales bacterium]MBN2842698.1 diaminopimelate decarboxylase [Sedimentisphaerales bacterium]